MAKEKLLDNEARLDCLAETDVVRAVDQWLRHDWPLDRYLFRVLPDERSSCAALEAHGLQEVDLALRGETRPYRWFGPAQA